MLVTAAMHSMRQRDNSSTQPGTQWCVLIKPSVVALLFKRRKGGGVHFKKLLTLHPERNREVKLLVGVIEGGDAGPASEESTTTMPSGRTG